MSYYKLGHLGPPPTPALQRYSPGNFSTFPKNSLRVGKYFNPRIACLFKVLIRLHVIRYYT